VSVVDQAIEDSVKLGALGGDFAHAVTLEREARLRPGIPVERGHAFRLKAATGVWLPA
jgi:hypothetical protein